MDIDLEGMLAEAQNQYGPLSARNLVLAGQLLSVQKQLAAAQSEIKELKKAKEEKPVEKTDGPG